MRQIFIDTLVDIAQNDETIYLISSDFGYGVLDNFIKRFPKRFLNLGICEQSIIGVAAGLALEGFKPYVFAITPFLIERPFEQLKLDIDQQNANVKLIGYADYPSQGPTHAVLDGPKLMSLFNNIHSWFPEDEDDLRNAVRKSYDSHQPAFISLKRISR